MHCDERSLFVDEVMDLCSKKLFNVIKICLHELFALESEL